MTSVQLIYDSKKTHEKDLLMEEHYGYLDDYDEKTIISSGNTDLITDYRERIKLEKEYEKLTGFVFENSEYLQKKFKTFILVSIIFSVTVLIVINIEKQYFPPEKEEQTIDEQQAKS